MQGKYPERMTYTQWRRTPFGMKHRLVGLAINNRLGYWRACQNHRCRRARGCQDYNCYWRRLLALPVDQRGPVRKAAEPLAKLLWIGRSRGAERYQVY
jgi:hypothetical protein